MVMFALIIFCHLVYNVCFKALSIILGIRNKMSSNLSLILTVLDDSHLLFIGMARKIKWFGTRSESELRKVGAGVCIFSGLGSIFLSRGLCVNLALQ